MTYDEFRASLANDRPPTDADAALQALWEDVSGNWEAAHLLVQDEGTTEAAWVHAYLHRKEGDPSNAAYWYRRCDKPVCDTSLEQEWESIVRALTD